MRRIGIDSERFVRSCLLVLILGVFLLVPLRIIAYGYMPSDDALRHTAFAVDDRNWGDIILLNPEFRPEMDGQAGWNSFLRFVHRSTDWDSSRLLIVSVVLAFLTFTMGGLLASGSPPAWFLGCTVMSVIEPALFGKLALGRPLFFSMAAVAVLLLIWTRERPLRSWVEAVIVSSVLTMDIVMHSSSWYLWAIAVPPLMACRRWRSLFLFGAALLVSIAAASLVNGWYNTLATPLLALYNGFLQARTLGTNLVSELQPSGAPFVGLLIVAAVLTVNCLRGTDLRGELFRVDFCFLVFAWIMGLLVGRLWIEWGLPAMAVWFTRQFRDHLCVTLTGLPSALDTLIVFGLAASVLYLGQTADVGGRYTNALRNPLLVAPVDDFAPELPEEGGILYSTDMGAFYAIYHRIPHLKFRFATAMEPGVMHPEDLKVLRAIQTTSLLRDYQPWFDKMTLKDRVFIRWPSKPEWPDMEFEAFYGAWMGRKIAE